MRLFGGNMVGERLCIRVGRRWAVACLFMSIAISGCTTAPLTTTIGKEPKLDYSCAGSEKNPGRAAIRCEGAADVFLKSTPPLVGTCEDLNTTFKPSTQLDVTIMSHLEYYLEHRIHAGLDAPLDISIVSDTDVGPRLIYVRVPVAYITDFTSTPRGPMQMFIRTFAKHIFPSLAHDFLYAVGPRNGVQRPAGDDGQWYTREFADRVLRSGMIRNGSGWLSYNTCLLYTSPSPRDS